jgi:flagellar assembly factor FliW
MIRIHTTRFGDLEVNPLDIVTLPEGILGFDSLKKFFIVDPSDDTMILWLQSTERAEIAFPILEPKVFKPDYKVRLSASELRSLKLDSVAKKETLVYCILTIPGDVTSMTANLKAPVVINTAVQMGRQVVLQENEYSVKFSIYKELVAVVMSAVSGQKKRSTSSAPLNQDSVVAPLELRTAAKAEVSAL